MICYMIILKDTIGKTATRSPLSNRGYKRSEHPRMVEENVKSTLKESPIRADGALFQSASPTIIQFRGYCVPSVIERRRFQRLGDTIANSHNLFSHQFNVPLFFGVVTKVLFSVSPQVPLADNFPLSERKSLTFFGMNKYVLISAKLAVADLFAPLLRLTAAPSTYWSPLSTFSHIDSNVMRGRRLSLRLSVKHYETSEMRASALSSSTKVSRDVSPFPAKHPSFISRYPLVMVSVMKSF